ncbi:unnamed protein product, partial [Meganyctiphanes norvegica]
MSAGLSRVEMCIKMAPGHASLIATTRLSPTSIADLQEDLVCRYMHHTRVKHTFSSSLNASLTICIIPLRNCIERNTVSNHIQAYLPNMNLNKHITISDILLGPKIDYIHLNLIFKAPSFISKSQFIFTCGKIHMRLTLNKDLRTIGSQHSTSIRQAVKNTSPKKHILIFVVQYVDVVMFSNGKFKNVVATLDTSEGCPVSPSSNINKDFRLHAERGTIKNWIALEEFYDRESSLASSVIKPTENGDKNVFAIYVSYYVKVKLLTTAIGGEVSVKVPFKIMRRKESEMDQNALNFEQGRP